MSTTSVNIYVVDAVTAASKQFAVNFTLGYLSRDHVTAFVEGEVDGSGDQIFRTITWINDGLVQLSGTLTVGQTVRVQRTTPADSLIHDFQAGAVLKEANLDEANLQALMIIHEIFDGRNINEFVDDINMNLHDILNAGTINTNSLFVGGLPITADNAASIPTETETKSLASGQLEVIFDSPTVLATFYLSGPDVDNGRLLPNTDYTIDHTTRTLTLSQSQPAGTQILMAYFGGDGTPALTGVSVYETQSALVAASLTSGARAVTAGFYAENDKGGADYMVVTPAEYGGAVKVGDWLLANGNIAVLQHNGTVNVRQFGAFHDILAINDKSNATDQSAFFEAASIYDENLKIVVPAGGYKVDSATTGLAFWHVEPGAEVRKTGVDFARVGLYRDLSNLSGAVRQWCKRPTGGTGTAFDGSSGYRVGDPEPYESNIIGHDGTSPLAGIGRNGSSGLFGIGRTGQNTDAPGTVKQQAGNEFYGIQDNTTNTSNSMTATYIEATAAPSTGRTIALEVTNKNFAGDSPDVTAVSELGQAVTASTTLSLHTSVGPDDLGAGSVDTSNWTSPTPGKVSYGIGFTGRPDDLDVAPGWQKGIIFFQGSITGTSGAAVEMFRTYQVTYRSEGGILEGRSANDHRRWVYGNDNTPTNTSENVFWRYRGGPLTKGATISGDIIGRHSYHGHQAGAGTSGFTGGATNALVTLETEQTGAVSGANASGAYKIRTNDGAGAYSGFDFLPARLRPTGDGVMDLGSGANRMNTIYAAVGTINTSDQRLKSEIGDLSQAELAVARQLKRLVVRYKLIGHGDKWHVGVIAQDVVREFERAGLDASDYGLLHQDAETGHYGVNYNELLCFCLAAI